MLKLFNNKARLLKYLSSILIGRKGSHGLFDPIPIIGIFEVSFYSMAKNTSILLGDYFEDFINSEVKSGRFSSASEVVRAALRLFEEEQNQKKSLIRELKKGEKSGFVKKFDRKKFLKSLHDKHVKNAV